MLTLRPDQVARIHATRVREIMVARVERYFPERTRALGRAGHGRIQRPWRYHYLYPDGAERFTKVAAPETSEAHKRFKKYSDLYDHFGKLGGGASGDYDEEFYNRNKFFNAGALASGSTTTAPKVRDGRQYIVPRRIEAS